MTRKQADTFIYELGCKDAVKQILTLLNGESYEDAKKILDAVAVYLKLGTFVDADLIKDIVDGSAKDEE